MVAEIELHMASCPRCRRWISELTRDSLVSPGSAHGGPDSPGLDSATLPEGLAGPELGRGDHVGRYVVQARVGAGAMGVVYAAYDPELDRKVALKLINPETADGSDATDRKRRLHR